MTNAELKEWLGDFGDHLNVVIEVDVLTTLRPRTVRLSEFSVNTNADGDLVLGAMVE